MVKNKFYVCDKNYKVLEVQKKQNKKLALIVGADIKKTEVGEKISFSESTKQETINTILSALKEKSVKINSLDVTELMDIKFRVEGRFDVELGSMAHFDGKIAQLAEMIKSAEKDTKGTVKLSDFTPENREIILKK